MSYALYNVGIYVRLSKEDNRYGDSVSIENQTAMLSDFITHMPGWTEERLYIDEGASGGNFNRKGFQDMMEDVREGLINLVLVKDLSRFGRNYLEAGHYLEEELPALGCRFVALVDGIDTGEGENDIIPFLNAINDFYLKDLSDRIKLVLTAKAKEGQKLSGTCPYGYERNPGEHTHLIIDEYAANVVRQIFELRAGGMGYTAIAGNLNHESVLSPRAYYFYKQGKENKADKRSTAACASMWAVRTIKLILNNELYIGNTVAFKRKTLSYRDNKKSIKRDENDWIRTENTHRPIISRNLWDRVQEINKTAKNKRINVNAPKPSLFSRLLICLDCNSTIGSYKGYSKGYTCRTNHRSGNSVCSPHRILEKDLKAIVLEQIKEIAHNITLDKSAIIERLTHRIIGENKLSKYGTDKERKSLERQLYTIELEMEQLFEDKFEGIISIEEFSDKINHAEAKRQEIESSLKQLNQIIEERKNKLNDINKWIALIQEKSTVVEVDRELLEGLIDKIEISERMVINGKITQDIRIFYKFIGLF